MRDLPEPELVRRRFEAMMAYRRAFELRRTAETWDQRGNEHAAVADGIERLAAIRQTTPDAAESISS